MPARNINKNRGRANFFKLGDNNIIDDRSGFKIKASTSKQEWNGHIVGENLWEARQPLDLLRGLPDMQSAQIVRPGNPNVFLTKTEVKASDL